MDQVIAILLGAVPGGEKLILLQVGSLFLILDRMLAVKLTRISKEKKH